MEFVGGPMDGEVHEIGAAVSQVTRMAQVSPPQMATYERRVSATTGTLVMVWVGLKSVSA